PTGPHPLSLRDALPILPGAEDTQAMLRAIHQHYIPNKVLFHIDPQHVTAALEAIPLLRDVLAGKAQVDGKATVYVCHNFTYSLRSEEHTSELQSRVDLV